MISKPVTFRCRANNTPMRLTRMVIATVALFILSAADSFGQTRPTAIPSIVKRDGRYALLVDGKPFLILGGQAHNSSAWPGMLPQLWTAVHAMHANTLEVPLYWEQIEPQPGKFDFSLIDTLLDQSRKHKVHLVLLWFATWKNGSNHYMPEWMKNDAVKYPNITGSNGKPVDSPSPFSTATLEADTRAFTAVMSYLKKADSQRTVIMVQVENEPGSWGSVRDYSPLAQKFFDGPVPAVLLKPEVLRALKVPVVQQGSWQQVFGENADEYFHAWSIAAFIGKVAAAGKAAYNLPLYVNAALRDPVTNPRPTSYESGGPTDNVIPIWKATAPAIDLLAPDIYLSGSEKILKAIELYARPDNALFVPEAGIGPDKAKYLYDILGHGGFGFAPFGIDDNRLGAPKAETDERLAQFAKEYAMATPMMRELAQWAFDGKIKAVAEHDDHAEQTIDLGAWQAVLTFGAGRRGNTAQVNNQSAPGKMMIVKLDENKFVLIGTHCQITFRPQGNNAGRAWQYLKVQEGRYQNGAFKPLRILNGDETDFGGPRFGSDPTALQATLGLR